MTKVIYLRGIASKVEIPCKGDITSAFEHHKQRLSNTVASRVDMARRIADREYNALGAARSGHTPVAGAYAEQQGYAALEKREASIEADAIASYEADVKSYELWIAGISNA